MRKKRIPREVPVEDCVRGTGPGAYELKPQRDCEPLAERFDRYEQTLYNLRVDVDAMKERLDWLESGEPIE